MKNFFRRCLPYIQGLLLIFHLYFLALKEMHFNYIQDGLKQNVLPISDCFSDEDEMIKAVLFSSLGTVLSHKNWDIVKGRLKKTNVFLTRYIIKIGRVS